MSSQSFPDVTIALLERVAAQEDAARFAIAIDADGSGGTMLGATPLGEVEAHFTLLPDEAEMSVTILQKPAFLPASLLWSEFARALACARDDPAA